MLFQGVGEMSIEERKEAVKLFSSVSPADVTTEMQELASASSSDAIPLLSANFARIATEAAITEMPPEELQSLMEVVQKDQQELIQPLMDVVPELSEEERKRLTESLVDNGFVSEEKRVVLEDTLKPGGHADQFASFIKWFKTAYQNAWLAWVLPPLEIGLALGLALLECKSQLFTYLAVDGVFAGAVALSAFAAKYMLRSTYKEFSDDPLGTLQRLRKAYEAERLREIVPFIKPAMHILTFCVLFIILGALWGIAGAYWIAETLWSSCPAFQRLTTAAVCSIIALIRIGVVIGVLALAWKGRQKIQQLQNRSSEPLLSQSEPSYGSVEDT
jgi:hypothetical protein